MPDNIEVLHMTIEQLIDVNSKLIRQRLAEMNVHTRQLDAMLAAYAQSMRISHAEAEYKLELGIEGKATLLSDGSIGVEPRCEHTV